MQVGVILGYFSIFFKLCILGYPVASLHVSYAATLRQELRRVLREFVLPSTPDHLYDEAMIKSQLALMRRWFAFFATVLTNNRLDIIHPMDLRGPLNIVLWTKDCFMQNVQDILVDDFGQELFKVLFGSLPESKEQSCFWLYHFIFQYLSFVFDQGEAESSFEIQGGIFSHFKCKVDAWVLHKFLYRLTKWIFDNSEAPHQLVLQVRYGLGISTYNTIVNRAMFHVNLTVRAAYSLLRVHTCEERKIIDFSRYPRYVKSLMEAVGTLHSNDGLCFCNDLIIRWT